MCSYRNKRTTTTKQRYVSTENMLQNYAGLEPYTEDIIADGIAIFRNDTLLANIRPYLKKVWKSEFDGACSTDVLAFSPDQIDSGFLYALIAQDGFIDYVMSGAKGSKMPRGDKSHIMDHVTHLPTEAEQRKISLFIELINKRIALQGQHIELLKKYKRGVMSSYFDGKLVLHRSNGQHYSHWQEFTLSDVSDEFKSGKSITSTEINDIGEYAVYGGNGVRGYTDHYSHEGQYIVVGRQGALCGNVRIIDGKNYLSEHAIAVKANSNHYTPFLLYLLADMRLGQYSDQGAQPGLAVNKLLKLKRKFPVYEEQVHFATFMQQIDSKLISEEAKLEYITTLKRGLLQQLFI